MAGLRKAVAYSKKKTRPYTRKSKKKSKSYIKTIPQQKIVKMRMGNLKLFNKGGYKMNIKLIAGEKVQIRDNALEACRQLVYKILEKEIPGQFYFELKIFPHHILRENKVYGGGSKGERVNTGMQASFGTTTGRAAIVKPGQILFLVAVNTEKSKKTAVKVLEKVKPKIPCRARVEVEEKK